MKTAREIRDHYNAKLAMMCPGTVAADGHRKTIRTPSRNPVWLMIVGWGDYAEDMRVRQGLEVGDDGVLSHGWIEIAHGLRTLLNGDLAGLDGGTCDSIIYDTLAAYGVDTSEW